jgi:hypothetical protein
MIKNKKYWNRKMKNAEKYSKINSNFFLKKIKNANYVNKKIITLINVYKSVKKYWSRNRRKIIEVWRKIANLK